MLFSEKLFGTRRGGLTRLQRRRQQQRSQYKVRLQPAREHLRQKASVGRSFTPTPLSLRSDVLVPSIGKSRPFRAGASERQHRNRRGTETRFTVQPTLLESLPEGTGRESTLPAMRVSPSRTQTSGNRSNRDKRGVQRQRPAAMTRSHPQLAPLVQGVRMLVLGVGLGAIAGTLLSVLNPAGRIAVGVAPTATVQTQPEQAISATAQSSALELKQEIIPLKVAVQQAIAQNIGLMPGVFFVDLDTGAYMDLNGTATFAAASTIKFPVLVAFFQDVDAGKIRLDEVLTLQPGMIGGGSGELQYKPPGTKFTALEVVTKMVTISDNTATNMLIARLGGADLLNQRFHSWNLTTTKIHNALPDLTGTNTTSPKDLANLMALVNRGDLVTLRSRDRLLDIMRRTVTDSLLPRGLGEGAIIAHKTGDIGSMVGDVGLVDMPSGKRYIAAVMVKRPYNDSRAQDLIRQVSRMAYEQFSKLAH